MTQVNRLTEPEVMSPTELLAQLHAAIEAGADAVYFGLTNRARIVTVSVPPSEEIEFSVRVPQS